MTLNTPVLQTTMVRHVGYYLRKGASRQLNEGFSMIPDPKDRPVMTADEAFAELGIDRSTGYKAIREGSFPLPVIRIGRVIRIPTAAVRRVLSLDGQGAETDDSHESSEGHD